MKEEKLLEVIRKLLASQDGKPEELLPVDILLTIRLLLQHADEQPVRLSQGTLALELGCTESTIQKSGERLELAGWATVETGRGRWMPNKYFVILDKLPLAELRRTVVSEVATKLAQDYMVSQSKAQPKRKLRRGSEQRYAFRLQTLIDRHKGDEGLVRRILRFALASPKYRSAALRGPHVIRRSWKSLEKDFNAAQTQEKAAA
jgi:biotin operon repressor